jgi:hypothetical protein
MLGGTTEKDGSHGTRKAAGLYRSFGRIALDDEDLGEAASANRWRSITKLAAVCHGFIGEIALKRSFSDAV